ncbi:nucleotide sugar dehydrogenase [Campylobacter sp.]|uniref:nucleotide sugar dehydrogenase n=1 Tax=Campylobacter sp. TaxID=205 RepID=UPI0026DDAB71|nr:nucleotide sugar dehydrogenase [Campylobacter sp.]MDO4674681.1 nucleotide sugar dehydrogenase [Campylobacter sp.]
MRIAVVGIGYVGLSSAIFLSKKHQVILYDIDEMKVASINKSIPTIKDDLIERFFLENPQSIRATSDSDEAYMGAGCIIIAINTDYDDNLKAFNTQGIDQIIDQAYKINPKALFIIRSTVPIGYTHSLRNKFSDVSIVFCPEFLREGRALYDALNPSRIVVGGLESEARSVADLFLDCLEDKAPVFLMDFDEAECVKLFSNAYLAMRIAFFNELHSYAFVKNLNPSKIIKAICQDTRIGDHYNNPSFGYGGYCLPKDTKQLSSQLNAIPHDLIAAVINSNASRKSFIADLIKKQGAKKIGIYRLAMKKNSDNFRNSVILDILPHLQGETLCIYEPLLSQDEFEGVALESDFEFFAHSCDLIVANRLDESLKDFSSKVFSADLFSSDF